MRFTKVLIAAVATAVLAAVPATAITMRAHSADESNAVVNGGGSGSYHNHSSTVDVAQMIHKLERAEYHKLPKKFSIWHDALHVSSEYKGPLALNGFHISEPGRAPPYYIENCARNDFFYPIRSDVSPPHIVGARCKGCDANKHIHAHDIEELEFNSNPGFWGHGTIYKDRNFGFYDTKNKLVAKCEPVEGERKVFACGWLFYTFHIGQKLFQCERVGKEMKT